ncbi:TPA: hypothetical protein ACH3X1_014071 [Trebouxia sp. C0004]
MPFDSGTIPVLEVGTIVEALRQHLGGTHDYALHCPRAAPSVGVVIGSGNMLPHSKTSKNNWQLMRAKPKL